MKYDFAVVSAGKSVKIGVSLDLVKSVSTSLWGYLKQVQGFTSLFFRPLLNKTSGTLIRTEEAFER